MGNNVEKKADTIVRKNETQSGDGGLIPPSDDLFDHFEIVVDQDADPVDWDEALASFLFACVRKRKMQQLAGKVTEEVSACA